MRFLILALLLVPSFALAEEKPQPPSRAELKKTEKDIGNFKTQRNLKDRAARVEVARALLEKGKSESGVRKYAFIDAALEYAAANGDTAVAASAIDALDEAFEVDHLALSVDLVEKVSKNATSEAEVSALCEHALAVLERSLAIVETKHMTRLVATLKAKSKGVPAGDLATRIASAIETSPAKFKKREDAQNALSGAFVKWCEQHFGKSIDRGECTDVAYVGLPACGVATGTVRDYVFGRKLGKHEPPRPGDVLVLHAVKARSGWYSAEHHVAVVKSTAGTKVTVFHQNWGKNRSIHNETFDMGEIVSGSFEYFRPIPPES